MKQIPIDEEKIPAYNKKAIRLILLLVICGVITGLILSSIFISETNYRIEHPEEAFKETFNGHKLPPRHNWNNSFNYSQILPYKDNEPLTTYEIILPTSGVIIVCISTYLLIGLIVIYIKIFFTTNSKYIVGLLLFLIPLFIQSIFSINTLRSLFVSSAIPYFNIRESIGFGFGGLGGILIMVSIFEIIGLSILLYLSTE